MTTVELLKKQKEEVESAIKSCEGLIEKSDETINKNQKDFNHAHSLEKECQSRKRIAKDIIAATKLKKKTFEDKLKGKLKELKVIERSIKELE